MLVYRSPDGNTRIDVELVGETLWLTQSSIAELFQTTRQNVSAHIGNIYEDEELDEAATSRVVMQQRLEGTRQVRREITLYNLDVIISVGYRVKSKLATQFRQWATERLVEYLVKGFTMDDERLKNPDARFGEDYFDELLERIRDIRASEKRFYQKVRDIFALSADYTKDDQQTREFFAIIQNKMLYSVTGMTAAEIIHARADHTKPNMGLTSWDGGRVRKKDVTVSKNYLSKEEIDDLDRLIVMYLDFAEMRARRQQPIYMHEWRERLDAFLQFNEREILDNYGTVSKAVADQTAFTEYEAFDAERRKREALETDEEDIRSLEALIDELDGEQQGMTTLKPYPAYKDSEIEMAWRRPDSLAEPRLKRGMIRRIVSRLRIPNDLPLLCGYSSVGAFVRTTDMPTIVACDDEPANPEELI